MFAVAYLHLVAAARIVTHSHPCGARREYVGAEGEVVDGFLLVPVGDVVEGERQTYGCVCQVLADSGYEVEGQFLILFVERLDLSAEVLAYEAERQAVVDIVVVDAEVDTECGRLEFSVVRHDDFALHTAAPTVGEEVCVAALDAYVLGRELTQLLKVLVGFGHRAIVEQHGSNSPRASLACLFDECGTELAGARYVGCEVEVECFVGHVGQQGGIGEDEGRVVFDDAHVASTECCRVC